MFQIWIDDFLVIVHTCIFGSDNSTIDECTFYRLTKNDTRDIDDSVRIDILRS